jgi:hypothetical protein
VPQPRLHYFGSRLRRVPGVQDWVLLTYRLPREPSTPRAALWRKLRRLGAVQLLDGLVALPLDARNREHFDWLADDVLEAGGDATVWTARPASDAEQDALRRRLSDAATVEYRDVAARAEAASALDARGQRRELAKLRRELQRIRRRDYLPARERDVATRALKILAEHVEKEPTKP